ncbi:MAG: hypothetical protein HC817_10270 [Saprospiraceae bacterium]|nr:hypothetical protein [Saprospiraceae bacterium]
MTSPTIFGSVKAYGQKHWFKLSLLLLLLIAFFKKDLNLKINLNSDKNTKATQPPKTQNLDKTKETDNINRDATGSRFTATDEKFVGNSDATPSQKSSIWDNFSSENVASDVFPNLDNAAKVVFLKRFADVAITERRKFGIPTSIILAAALRHSYAGTRDATKKGQNHFALPCTKDWRGAGLKIGSTCFRQYENAWASFRDHSFFITSGKFASLRSLGSTNYKAWAQALEANGYPSGGNQLAEDLISIIEQFQLHELDSK